MLSCVHSSREVEAAQGPPRVMDAGRSTQGTPPGDGHRAVHPGATAG